MKLDKQKKVAKTIKENAYKEKVKSSDTLKKAVRTRLEPEPLLETSEEAPFKKRDSLLSDIAKQLLSELKSLRTARRNIEYSVDNLYTMEINDFKEMSSEYNDSISHIENLQNILSILKHEREAVEIISGDLQSILG